MNTLIVALAILAVGGAVAVGLILWIRNEIVLDEKRRAYFMSGGPRPRTTGQTIDLTGAKPTVSQSAGVSTTVTDQAYGTVTR